MPTRFTTILLALLVVGTPLLPMPALVLGDAADERTMACVPGQPCSMPEACEVSSLAVAREARTQNASHGCCTAEDPSTPTSDLPPEDDSCSRCRCFAGGVTAIVAPTGFALVVHMDSVTGRSVTERPSRIPAPETPPPRRSL
jgi:hypothetical protein